MNLSKAVSPSMMMPACVLLSGPFLDGTVGALLGGSDLLTGTDVPFLLLISFLQSYSK